MASLCSRSTDVLRQIGYRVLWHVLGFGDWILNGLLLIFYVLGIAVFISILTGQRVYITTPDFDIDQCRAFLQGEQ